LLDNCPDQVSRGLGGADAAGLDDGVLSVGDVDELRVVS
jgi:hypothetical protein